MSHEYDEGRMDAWLGRDNASRYRRAEKKAEYRRGYQCGLREKQEDEIKDVINNMDEEERRKSRDNIQRLKDIITG